MNKLYARDVLKSSKILADRYFGNLLNDKEYYDCQFIDIKYQHLLIIGSFKYQVPALKELYKNEVVGEFLNRLSLDKSHLFKIDWDTEQIIYYVYSDGNISTEIINPELFMRVKNHRFTHGIITTVHFRG